MVVFDATTHDKNWHKFKLVQKTYNLKRKENTLTGCKTRGYIG
jgi:hypothetical protein